MTPFNWIKHKSLHLDGSPVTIHFIFLVDQMWIADHFCQQPSIQRL